jgi:hypothetical protein
MTTPADPDAASATRSPATTARYPRNRLVRLLRNLLWPTGVGVVTLVVMTITARSRTISAQRLGDTLSLWAAWRRNHSCATRAGRSLGSL